MIDLNTLISNALTAAINSAVAPLNARIAALESANDILHRVQHEDMVAMRDRIAALEDQAIVTSNAVDTRISRLENNPAQGVDTQAPSVLAAQYTPISNDQVKAALQEWATKDSLVEYLDQQEWFWEKLQNRIDAATEQAMDHHLECYDHDNYDEMASKVDDLPDNLDDCVTRDELRSEIEDVLNNATLSLSI